MFLSFVNMQCFRATQSQNFSQKLGLSYVVVEQKKERALYEWMKNLQGLSQAILHHAYITCTKAMIIETSCISWRFGVDISWGFRGKSSNRGITLNFHWGS